MHQNHFHLVPCRTPMGDLGVPLLIPCVNVFNVLLWCLACHASFILYPGIFCWLLHCLRSGLMDADRSAAWWLRLRR